MKFLISAGRIHVVRSYPMKTFLLSAIAISSLGVANAQTLSRFAPANAIASIELNDIAGARKQSSALFKELEKLNLGTVLAEATNSSRSEQRQLETMLTDFGALVEREGLVSLYLSPKNGQVGFLLAARPAQNADAKMQKWMLDSAKSMQARGSRVSGFPVYQSSLVNFGYTGGLAYAASDTGILNEFFSRVRNQNVPSRPSLAASPSFAEVMNQVGGGNMRLYFDLRNASQLARGVIDMIDPEIPGIKLEPVLDALTTYGRFAGAWRITTDGIENTTITVPEARGADSKFAQLLTPKDPIELKAASVVPATATTFSTSSNNFTLAYDWLSSLVDRTGVNPGGLDNFFKSEFGIDARKSVLGWMTGELASASFVGKGATQALGESVQYIGTKDPKATEEMIEKVLPKLIEIGQKLAQQKVNNKFTKTQLGGTNIYRFVIAENTPVVLAVKDNFLMVATSDTGITAALAGGARLETSQNYKNATARVPKDALGWSYGDTTASLKSAAEGAGGVLELVLGLGLDLKPSTSRKLVSGITGLLTTLSERAGSAISWTEAAAVGTKTRSFQPMKW
jgi:Protein of unknown function (DUF3352)